MSSDAYFLLADVIFVTALYEKFRHPVFVSSCFFNSDKKGNDNLFRVSRSGYDAFYNNTDVSHEE